MSKDLDNAMTKQSLDERIERFIRGCDYSNNMADVHDNAPQALKQLLKDVITEVLPEKVEVFETDSNAVFARKDEWNYAIDTIQKNVDTLLGNYLEENTTDA